MSATSLFLVSYAPLHAPDRNSLSPICIDVLITGQQSPYITVCFLYLRISFWPLSAIKTLSHYAEINSDSKKKTHTKESRRHFCLFSLVVGIDFFQ